ncbi:AN1-type zinc finger protein 2B [Araneus ventricosus]|uniref:AN1-type zinc finger protein 2B n=1 Tax=Araneus ventricosus TaxID=182803 RepID=A0A4Y2HZU8_ARAVE|nr:AN1-type zinc finger protein 2B [Araneus ventricosus]
MEFPHLGNHCHVKTCNRLDFLPMKCDACSNLFCIDHFTYNKHSCDDAFQKDVQVPVCPLCNNPVPSKRGEQPDIAVSQHIDRDCQADPAIAKRKIYTNKCNVKGCKQKEVIRITCDICHKSYCLKHRHPADHKCEEQKAVSPAQAAGAAAIARAQNSKKSIFNWFSSQSSSSDVERKPVPSPLPEVSITSIHGRLSEDEALALALQQSLNETKPRSVQEEEDRLLALSLANCDQRRVVRNQENRDKNCIMS